MKLSLRGLRSRDTNIPTFIALLGGKLDFVVVIDGSTNPQRIETAIERGRMDGGSVISLTAMSSVADADIEDLFTPAEYLAFYNGAFSKSVALGDIKGKDRIVSRLTRKEGEFNHGIVAAYFLRNLTKSIKDSRG